MVLINLRWETYSIEHFFYKFNYCLRANEIEKFRLPVRENISHLFQLKNVAVIKFVKSYVLLSDFVSLRIDF